MSGCDPDLQQALAQLEADYQRAQERAERMAWALSMLRCPYYDHQGTCNQGCSQEPACQVDEPIGGWLEFAYAESEEAVADA